MCDNYLINCKLFKNKCHLLKDPKILPCSNTACLECIKKAMNKTNFLKCDFKNCKERHILIDLKKLVTNNAAQDYINNNLRDISVEMNKSFLDRFRELKEKTSDLNFHLGGRVDYAINEIDIKIESIKIDLDKLVGKIDMSLAIIEYSVNSEMNIKALKQELKAASVDNKTMTNLLKFYKTIKNMHKIKEFEKFENDFKLNLEKLNQFEKVYQRKSSASHSNSTVRLRNLYECEKLVNIFKSLTPRSLVNKLIFTETQYSLKSSIIGKYIDPTLLTIESIENVTPVMLKMEQFKSMRCLTALDDSTLLVSDSKSNNICVFNSQYELINSVSCINNERLEFPVGICTDGTNVYICDHNNSRIVVTNKELTRIRNIFGTYGPEPGKFDCPIEICCYGSSLYILDRGNKRIQEFTLDGKYLRNLPLYKLEQKPDDEVEIVSLTFPLSFKMAYDKIAVVNAAKVYVYNFQGSLIQTLTPNNIKCICFVNEQLFTINNEAFLTCYTKSSNKKTNYELIEAYSYRFESLRQQQIYYMTLFNSDLVLCTDNTKLLIKI